MKNVPKLPKLELTSEEAKCLEEESKEQKPSEHLPPFEENGVYKTLFGH